MRAFKTAMLSRVAIVALMTTSFALPIILDASSAAARTAGTAGNGPSGPAGAATGGGTTGAGGSRSHDFAVLNPGEPPRIVRLAFPRLGTPRSCYQAEPMFDRWGDYVGKRQNDFCW